MKKSSILTKIVLALVLVALICSLAACAPKTPAKDDGDKKDPPAEASLAEQVVEILQGVNPLLATLNDVKADGTLGAAVSLSVDYTAGASTGSHTVAINANANATSPEAQISYKNGSGEWLNLTYSDKKVYLVQPVTAINEAKFYGSDGKAKYAVDKTVTNVAALNPAVTDMMTVAMDALASIDGLALPTGLEDSINEMLQSSLGQSIGGLLTIEKTANGNKIVLGQEIMSVVSSLLPTLLGGTLTSVVGADLSTTIINGIKDFLATNPVISLEVTQSNNKINGLNIGYEQGENKGTLKLGLDLKNEAITVSAPTGCEDKALNIGVGAELAQKGAKANLEAYGVADLSADLKNLVYADLTVNNQKSYGYFNGQEVVFNTDGLYAALNGGSNASLIEKPANTTYKATIQTAKSATDSTLVANSIVKMINNAAKKFKDNYNSAKASNADDANTVAPKKNIEQNIYEFLGGTLKTDKDGNYVKVTEKEMMTQLKIKIGDYVRFEIDDTSDSDNYFKTVKNIIKLFGDNDEWIIGTNLIKDNLNDLKSFMDLISIDKWIVKEDDRQSSETNIFNWNTATYRGGVTLTKSGEKNDLLDAVNVFAAAGKEGEVYKDIDAKFIADFVNYYVAAFGYYLDKFSDSDKAAIDKIDMEYAYAKFANATDKETFTDDQLKAAKEKHKNALKAYYTAAMANTVVKEILGGTYTDGAESYIEQLINGGLYLHIGSDKNEGLNGFIEIKDSVEGTKSYAKIDAHIRLVANDVNAKVAAARLDAGTATELYAPAKVTAADPDADYYRIIIEVNGVKQVQKNIDPVTEEVTYSYVYTDEYKDRFVAAEELINQLYTMALKYLDYVAAA